MAQEGSPVEEGEGQVYEKIIELGQGLSIARVVLDNLREQDVNARTMNPAMFKQLVANVKKRGSLESLPFCALVNGRVEIISGHHRSRAAREAGLKEITVLLDESGLSRSQIAAKQLAHNSISGFDDQNIIRQIAQIITDVDDMLEAHLPKDILTEPEAVLDTLIAPKVDFDWKTVSFVFLPHQLDDMKALINSLEGRQDLVSVAPIELFKAFADAVIKFSRFMDIRSAGTAVAVMARTALEIVAEVGIREDDEPWVALSSIFGSGTMPKEAAEVVRRAVKQMQEDGHVGKKNLWQAIEYWAADYLGGE
ncbi:MAG: chromosome partitioning protein ParB [Ammonifex sp.]|jgi:hypothetical protein|nr:MAG: chromosome partitioning protein ParB [Ammonifex sp.]